MKTATTRYSFAEILQRLAQQNPEEKLRIAFHLNDFVKKVQKAGEKYVRTNQRRRTRTTA